MERLIISYPSSQINNLFFNSDLLKETLVGLLCYLNFSYLGSGILEAGIVWGVKIIAIFFTLSDLNMKNFRIID